MFATLMCLQQHDLRLVAWAAVICVAAVAASLAGYRRVLSSHGPVRTAWTAVVALLLGSGVWATHFVAMLAYQRELQVSFAPGLTALSLVVAVAGIGLGVAVAASRQDWAGRPVGGAVCGGAIALMHFVGVAAMRLPADIVWNPSLVAQAIAISLVFASGAFLVAGGLDRPGRWAGAGVLLVLAIVGLHFTAMAAVTLIPDAAVQVGPDRFGRHELATGVMALIGLIIMAGGALVAVDRITARANRRSMLAALNCAPSPLAMFDRNDRLTFWNDAYAEFLLLYDFIPQQGLHIHQIIAASARLGLPHDPEEAPRNAFGGAPERAPFLAPDGRSFQPRQGQTPDGGHVVLLTDISALQALSLREVEARRAAEAANQAKSEFLANMSHEIRTPLNAVLGMAQVMQRNELNREQAKRLDIIADNGRALNAILNNVLDLSKIEAGRMVLEIHAFDVAGALERVAAAHAQLAAKKNLRFAVELDPAVQGQWRGDSAKLGQVINNLLSNAVKFTDHGQITLRAAPAPGGLRFEVADSGLGVPADKQGLVFEAFTQADASTTRRFGGTGLGLAISRRLVALMGGALTLDSVEGRGSTFTFVLPLEREPDRRPQPAGVAGEADLADGEPLYILAAEDNATNQLILKALLEPLGARIVMAANGREAVEAFTRQRFDLVLMDVQMPEMNGLEATLAVRKRERNSGLGRTPILAVTANVMSHQVQSYLDAGMDGFVAKPIEMAALLEAMQAALSAQPEGAAAQGAA